MKLRIFSVKVFFQPGSSLIIDRFILRGKFHRSDNPDPLGRKSTRLSIGMEHTAANSVNRFLPRPIFAVAILSVLSFLIARAADTPAQPPQPLDLKFQFGLGKEAVGYVRVPSGAVYRKGIGYGFEPGAAISDLDRGGDAPLRSGGCASDRPFFFSTDVPEGNYRVTVTLGDAGGVSETTVKAELRRLMLEDVRTAAGQFETRSLVVNVRTPRIAGGGEVSLKAPRETSDEAWAWDGRLTLEFNGRRPCLCALEIQRVEVPTVFLLGDSTVCDQPHEPYASWGQMLPRFFKPEVAVANHAESGETLRGSTSARRIDKVLGEMKAGDYLFIQYGHNDMKSKEPDALAAYEATLRRWIGQVRAKGGVPVLVTPMNRHRFEGATVVNTLREYPDRVRQVVAEEKTPLIDLNAFSKTLYEALGPAGSIQLFKHDSMDDPKFDRTHHSPYGAYELAKCVCFGLRQAKLDLAKSLVEDVLRFDPAKPDPAAEFHVPPSPGSTTQRPLGD
jgi:lysophospholipase L1-like esterase